MKYKDLLIVLIVPFFLSCQTPQEREFSAKPTEKIEADSCLTFCQDFPDNIDSFNALYGYSDADGPAKLYDIHLEHINFFYSCDAVSDTFKLEKSFGLTLDAKWEADAPSWMQVRVIDMIEKDTELAIFVLSTKNSTEIRSFWSFLLDGPHPKDPQNQKTVKKLIAQFNEHGDEENARMIGEIYDSLSDEH